jgi:hypothetical protein
LIEGKQNQMDINLKKRRVLLISRALVKQNSNEVEATPHCKDVRASADIAGEELPSSPPIMTFCLATHNAVRYPVSEIGNRVECLGREVVLLVYLIKNRIKSKCEAITTSSKITSRLKTSRKHRET